MPRLNRGGGGKKGFPPTKDIGTRVGDRSGKGKYIFPCHWNRKSLKGIYSSDRASRVQDIPLYTVEQAPQYSISPLERLNTEQYSSICKVTWLN